MKNLHKECAAGVALVICSAALLTSCVADLVDPSSMLAPSLSGVSSTVTAGTKSVTLSADVSNSSRVDYAGFYWSADKSLSGAAKVEVTPGATLKAGVTPSGYGGTYYYKAYISNGHDEIVSEVKSFRIKEFSDYVVLGDAKIVTMDAASVQVRSSCSVAEGVNVTSRGFCYVTDGDPTTQDSCVEVPLGKSDFSASIPCTKQCRIRGYVKDGEYVTYTEAISAVQVDSVSLDRTSLALNPGASATLTATVLPATAFDKSVSWSSSDAKVATVTDGTVTAVGNGTATVTASSGTESATCEVTVTTAVTDVTLSKSSLSLNVGDSETLTATVQPATASDKSVSWSSSDEKVATVKDGKVTAVGNGTAKVIATSGTKSATCGVTVTTAVTGITLSKLALSLNVGDSETLTATVLPSTASEKSVSWSSSDGKVATVKDGKVTAVGNGTAKITATSGTKSATCEVTVTTAVTGIALSKSSLSIYASDSETLTATVLPATATDKSIIWSSSDSGVASVSSSGLVTALSLGSCIVTATAHNGVKATCSVTVYTYTDLSSSGTANCYIVSKAGSYKFKGTVKGNSSEPVGTPVSAEVLWESFGTSTAPGVGDIVRDVSYSDGYVRFSTPSSLKDGNAVIAVKSSSGAILWSWHIWVCSGFDPASTSQTYNNGAGTMMDRNLGATSAAKGSVGALGLLYQWGRKDPFPGSSSISGNTEAKSTISWPSAVSSTSSTGTISYAVAHPTTFITYNSSNYDWYYTGSSSTDNTRWTNAKTKYDPCPPGWRVPDGGSSGVWSKAFGTSSDWTTSSNWDSTNRGMDFGSTDGRLGSGTIWFPASGFRDYGSGSLCYVGSFGYYWSCTPNGYYAFVLYFYSSGNVYPSNGLNRAYGQSVRCLSE